MTDHRQLISDYLLGELSPEQRDAFERELKDDPQFAEEVARLRPVVSELEALPAEAWEQHDPPPLVLPSDRPAAQTRARQSWWRGSFSLKPAVALAAAIMLFAVGATAGLIAAGDGDSPSAPAVTAQQADLEPVRKLDAGASGVADVDGDGDGMKIRIDLSGLKPSGENDFYEAWLMDPKNGLVGIGTFRVGADGSASLDLPVPVGTDQFPIVDISLQQVNGKPDHSGVSVLRGSLS